MKKRYEDYSYEELKETFLDENKRNLLITYVYDDVFSILYKRLYVEYKDKTEECIIEIYDKFIENVIDGSFKGGEKEKPLQALKAYWASMAFFHFLNVWRKEQRNAPEHTDINEYEKTIFNSLDTEKVLQNEEELFLLDKAMNDSRLQDKCRTLIRARFYEIKSYEEIFQENPSISASVPALRKAMETCMNTIRAIFTTLN